MTPALGRVELSQHLCMRDDPASKIFLQRPARPPGAAAMHVEYVIRLVSDQDVSHGFILSNRWLVWEEIL